MQLWFILWTLRPLHNIRLLCMPCWSWSTIDQCMDCCWLFKKGPSKLWECRSSISSNRWHPCISSECFEVGSCKHEWVPILLLKGLYLYCLCLQSACSLVGFWADKPGWYWFVVRGKHCCLADKHWLKPTSEQVESLEFVMMRKFWSRNYFPHNVVVRWR